MFFECLAEKQKEQKKDMALKQGWREWFAFRFREEWRIYIFGLKQIEKTVI